MACCLGNNTYNNCPTQTEECCKSNACKTTCGILGCAVGVVGGLASIKYGIVAKGLIEMGVVPTCDGLFCSMVWIKALEAATACANKTTEFCCTHSKAPTPGQISNADDNHSIQQEPLLDSSQVVAAAQVAAAPSATPSNRTMWQAPLPGGKTSTRSGKSSRHVEQNDDDDNNEDSRPLLQRASTQTFLNKNSTAPYGTME